MNEWIAWFLTTDRGVGGIQVLNYAHALAVAAELRISGSMGNASIIQQLVGFIILCLGGTGASAMLAGEAPGWLSDPQCFWIYFFVWFAVYYSPRDVVFRLVCWRPFFRIVQVLDSFSWGFAITTWGVELPARSSNSAIRSALLPRLLCGVLSGSGGGLISDMFSLTKEDWDLETPKVYMGPSVGLAATLVVTVIYSLAGLYPGLVPPDQLPLVKFACILYITAVYFFATFDIKPMLRTRPKKRRRAKRD
mmetsp:Transcript_31633/g.88686  ORF Transcript_31633/g.88686 Transcript_31633/m.88686 type:complete len:250 (-) Transcript_31633:23-772(-)